MLQTKMKEIINDIEVLQEKNNEISSQELEDIFYKLKSNEVKNFLKSLIRQIEPVKALKQSFFSPNSYFMKFLFKNQNHEEKIQVKEEANAIAIIFSNKKIRLEINPLFNVEYISSGSRKKTIKIIKKEIDPEEYKKKIREYLELEGEFFILTNMEEWFFFDKNFSLSKEDKYFARKKLHELIEEVQETKSFNEYILELEKKAFNKHLEKKFFKSLKKWVRELKKVEFNVEEKKKAELIISFINKLVFIQALDSYSVLEKNFLLKTWNENFRLYEEKDKFAFLKKFFDEINESISLYFGNKLFNNKNCILNFIENQDINIAKFIDRLRFILGVNYEDSHSLKREKGIIQYNYKRINVDVLGKTYETFLTEIRKNKGIYYTPNYIIEYIIENLVEKTFDEIIENVELNLKKQNFDKCHYLIKKFISIKILDPACGTNSFLIRALRAIWIKYEKLIEVLSEEEKKHSNNKNSLMKSERTKVLEKIIELKNEIIHKSNNDLLQQIILRHIYGIDLDSKALEVGKLNLILEIIKISSNNSLFEKAPVRINPFLPNLEMNFIYGDSLIGLPESIALEFLEKKHKKEIKELFKQRNKYLKNPYNEEPIEKIHYLKNKIKQNLDLRFKLYLEENNLSFEILEKTIPLHWQIDFWFIYFNEDGRVKELSQRGFDIVIGNPPYIDYRSVNPQQAHQFFKKNYFSCINNHEKYNIFVPFIERALIALKIKGQLGFINSIHVLSSLMSKKLRIYILEKFKIDEIVDLSSLPVFKDASTYPMLIFIKKEAPINNFVKIAYRTSKKEITKKSVCFEEIEQAYFAQRKDKVIFIDSKPQTISIIKKLETKGKTLDKIIELKWGTSKSGYSKRKIKKNTFNHLPSRDKKRYLKMIQSSDIKRYEINWLEEYIPKEIYSPSQIELFKKPKIVISRQSVYLEVAYDCKGEYALGKVGFTHKFKEKISRYYLLAILNSKITDFYYKKVYETLHMSGNYIRYDIPYLYNLPIITGIEKEKESIINEYVKKILLFKKLRTRFKQNWKYVTQSKQNKRNLKELIIESKTINQGFDSEKKWILNSNYSELLDNASLMKKRFDQIRVITLKPNKLRIYGITHQNENLLLELTTVNSEIREIIYLEILNFIESKRVRKTLKNLLSKVWIPAGESNTWRHALNLLGQTKERFKNWLLGSQTELISCYELESTEGLSNIMKKFLNDFVDIDKEIREIDHILEAYMFKIFNFSEKDVIYVLDSLGFPESDIGDILSKFGAI